MIRNCNICSKEFKTNKKELSCSKRCKQDRRNQLNLLRKVYKYRNCIICGNEYKVIGSKKTCSKECSKIRINIKRFPQRLPINCQECNKTFIPRGTKTICSKECVLIRKRRVMKENYIKNKSIRLEYAKKYRRNNPNKIRESNKKHYKKRDKVKVLSYHIKHLNKYGLYLNLASMEYAYALMAWKKLVKEQQYEECAVCGINNNIAIHHIFYKSKYPKLSLNPNNGIPLCHQHHMEVHYGIVK